MGERAICDLIQFFKSVFKVSDDGVNYAAVVALYLYDYSFLGFIKKVFFSLFFSPFFNARKGCGDILIYYSGRSKGRPDYDYIPEYLYSLISGRCEYLESRERFSIFQPFLTLQRLPSAWNLSIDFSRSFFLRLGCSLLIAKYKHTACVFSDCVLNRGYKKVITFCDAHPSENLLAQLAKSAGAVTYTNQHGQYRVLSGANISPDVEAYSNFVSDRMLCWGGATLKEFERAGIDPGRMVVTGWIRSWNRLDVSRVKCGAFGVMLNAESSARSNTALLEAAKEISRFMGLKYYVRLHPWSTVSMYQDLTDCNCISIGHFALNEYFSRVEFSVANMTGATIEVLCMGGAVYLLDDGNLADVFKLDGLSYSRVDDIICAAQRDALMPEEASLRIARIGRWYNDDAEQSRRILNLLLT